MFLHFNSILADSPLNLNPIEILWHIVNLVILVAGLWLILFKPVKKFIARRSESVAKIVDSNTQLSEEIEKQKAERDNLIAENKKEIKRASEEAAAAAKVRANDIIERANIQANEILQKSRQDSKLEQARVLNDLNQQIAEISVSVAEKILERDISSKDNEKLIEEALENWKK